MGVAHFALFQLKSAASAHAQFGRPWSGWRVEVARIQLVVEWSTQVDFTFTFLFASNSQCPKVHQIQVSFVFHFKPKQQHNDEKIRRQEAATVAMKQTTTSTRSSNMTTNRTLGLLVAAVWLAACASWLHAATAPGHHQATASFHSARRIKRSLYELPDGAELVVGTNLRTTFSCDGLGYGYYADMDNQCKIFHICQSFKMSDGSIFNNHWSFLCGNQTIFNQATLACSHPEDAVPCENARDFYHVNDYFGDVRSPSVRDSDLLAAQELVSRSYGARLSSAPKNDI